MPSKKLALTNKGIDDLIREIRGQKVILDTDLAALYGVPTKRLNEQFRRNRKRFPDDFAFQLTIEEDEALRSQNATSSLHGGRQYPEQSGCRQNEPFCHSRVRKDAGRWRMVYKLFRQ